MLDFLIFASTAILGLLILLAVYLLYGSKKDRSIKTTLPTTDFLPGWDRLPAEEEMGDLKELSEHGSLHQYLMYLHEYGRKPLVVFWWGKQRVVSVCSPDLFKDTIKLTYRPKLLFTLFEPLISEFSIQYANGLDWEERRKALYPTLRDECLEDYIPCFINIAEESAIAWSNLSMAIDLQEEFLMMTVKGVTRTCFGNVFNNEEEVQRMALFYYKAWNEMEQRLHTGPPDPGSEREEEFETSKQYICDAVMRVINQRRNGNETKGIPFIDALLQTQVPDEQIMADAISFIVGGMHTSGYFMVWFIHYLSLHPNVRLKILLEIKEKVGDDRGNKLKNYVYSTDSYLRQVFDETLRLSTLAPYAARYSDHDIAVGGYKVPAGTPIIHALGVSLKNKTLWNKPDCFDPSHCHSANLKGKAFSPFGMGRRKCPGYLFSYVEVGTFMTILLPNFVFNPMGGAKEIDQVHGLVTSPKESLRYTISPITK